MTEPVVRPYCTRRTPLGTVRRVARQATKPRPVRMTDDLWKRALATAEAAGENLPDAIRDFVAWYARVPGARPPRRPAAPPTDD